MDEYPGPIGYIVGVISFFAGWMYAISAYGWFLGLGLGWLPAIFIALIVACLWPVVLAVLVGGGLLIFLT